MKILVSDHPLTVTANLIADHIEHTVTTGENAVLGLATGRTMERLYALLVRRYRAGELDFGTVTTFNLDEYIGLPADDPNSYRHYMQAHLFSHVNIHPDRTHLPDGMACDPDAECTRYEHAIRNAGGIGLQLLGIGTNGHIGFNEPPSRFDTRTRPVTLDIRTRQQNAAMFGHDPERVPPRALTMGVGTIMEARQLVLLATGPAKAAIVRKALRDAPTDAVSASAIQTHPDCTIVLDAAAASALG